MDEQAKVSDATESQAEKELLPSGQICQVCGAPVPRSIVVYTEGSKSNGMKIVYMCQKHHDLWTTQQREAMQTLAQRRGRKHVYW